MLASGGPREKFLGAFVVSSRSFIIKENAGVAMDNQLYRLLKLITLIQAYPGIRAKRLAAECEVTERTIYRDIDRLAQITTISKGRRGEGYRFVGQFALYPLDLTEEEIAGLQAVAAWVETAHRPLPPGWKTAYQKVMAAHAKEKKVNQEFLERVGDVVRLGNPAWAPETPNVFPELLQAVIHRRPVKALYHSQSRDQTGWRRIDPYYLIPREHRFYVIGYCHTRKEFRTFRVSRFLELRVLDGEYEKRPFDLNEYMKYTWSIERGASLIRFVVKFSPKVARYVKEEELFLRPQIRELPDGSLWFQVVVNGASEFLRWLWTYGPDAEILEPKQYRDHMVGILRQWLEKYERVQQD
ncbi:MAG TPA: transcriptional regulator [Alicyclobacillus sp.]|nr:transcriptional regulator [Alicyclobacillus sp.]